MRIGRERVRGREPEVTLEDVAEQTGLSQASIRQYVLAAWRRRPATEEEEEGGGQVSSLPAAGEGAAAVVAADLSAVGAKRQREEEEGDGAEKEENDEEGGEDTTAATTSDVSSSGSSSSSSSSSSNGSADSQVAPLPSSDAIEGEGREEGEEVVVLVEETEVITAEVTVTEISGSSGSSGEEDEEDEDEDGEEAALRRIDFRRVKDQLMRARPGYDSGCTAVVALLQGPREALVVANAGDSRCVLSRRGRAVDLSRDHKPDDPGELERIRAAGGSVAQGRVNGNLNLSRSLGDLTYKDARLAPARQMITAHPEVRRVPLEPTDEFAVLACDGVWNVLTSQQVVDHVRSGLARGVPLSALCEELCDRVSEYACWAGAGLVGRGDDGWMEGWMVRAGAVPV